MKRDKKTVRIRIGAKNGRDEGSAAANPCKELSEKMRHCTHFCGLVPCIMNRFLFTDEEHTLCQHEDTSNA